MGGPRYHYDPTLVSTRKFPAFYDDKWFIAEWNNGWIKTADLNASGAMTNVQNFALGTGYRRPMDLDFGPDGALYVIEWGSGFNGNNADSGVYRVDYIRGDQTPVAQAAATPTEGLAPLTVNFSSAGSNDPEGTPITYAWDFGDGATSTAANPSHTFTSQRHLPGQAHRHRRGRPDRRRQHRRDGRQPHAAGHDRGPRERPDRLVPRPDPLPDLGHRPRGRHDRRGHQLRRRPGDDLARP